jgi:hypothetical protein
MANTYQFIASVTVGSGGAANIDLTSIPSTYTDLLLKLSLRNVDGVVDNYFAFNGSTSSFTARRIYATGSAVVSDTTARTAGFGNSSGYTASTFSNNDIYIPNYAGSTNKSYSVDSVTENNATQAYSILAAGLWSNTAAINQITITAATGNLAQHSSAYLYGIKNS